MSDSRFTITPNWRTAWPEGPARWNAKCDFCGFEVLAMPLCDSGSRIHDIATTRDIFLCRLRGELLPGAIAVTEDRKAVCSDCLKKFSEDYCVERIPTWTEKQKKC